MKDAGNKKTLIAALASHDSIIKNNELARVFEYLYDTDKDPNKELIRKFHFIFCGGTFNRVILGRGKNVVNNPTPDGKETCEYINNLRKTNSTTPGITEKIYPIRNDVKKLLLDDDPIRITVLPQHTQGGVTILANLVVQRQVNIVWPFLSPVTEHLLRPENLALIRLCDHWNAKRLMNAESVRAWFHYEAEDDGVRNPQKIPITMAMGTSPEYDQKLKKAKYPLPEAKEVDPKIVGLNRIPGSYYELRPDRRNAHPKNYYDDPSSSWPEQTIALIAHDAMKSKMVDFAIQYENELNLFARILATGTTGQEVENACRRLREGKKIKRCLSGPKGGDIEIATEILFNRCHLVIFFIDPLNPHPHIDDIRVVMSACMAEILNNDVRILTNDVQARDWIEKSVRRKAP